MFGREQAAAIRAGFFVVIVSVGMAVIIFVLGTERGLFKQRYEIKTTFSNVRGLREGAPVRLAGMDVGEVDAILFPKGLAEKNMEVVMRMSKGVQDRIREDSEATIKWLSYVTGDSYIEITIGSSDKPAVKEGGYVMGIQPIDYTAAFEGSINTLNAVAGRFKNLEEGGFFDALSVTAGSLRAYSEEIKSGKGLLHTLIFDPEGGKILGSISQGVQEFNDAAKKFSRFQDRLDTILTEISTNEGLLHSLLYDAEKSEMLDNLSVTLANLKVITDKTAAGEGTLGAIINDPTLYDDLKMLLRGAERSYVLRKLIRHSLENAKKVEAEQSAPTK